MPAPDRPHKAAVAARWLFSRQFTRVSYLSTMAFWQTLGPVERDAARRLVHEVGVAPQERRPKGKARVAE